MQAANYSLGVNLLLELVKKAATILGPQYDVEVVEMHHKHKKDAPSGTALMLAKSAAEGRGVTLDDKAVYGRHGDLGERPVGEIAIHALRGGAEFWGGFCTEEATEAAIGRASDSGAGTS